MLINGTTTHLKRVLKVGDRRETEAEIIQKVNHGVSKKCIPLPDTEVVAGTDPLQTARLHTWNVP